MIRAGDGRLNAVRLAPQRFPVQGSALVSCLGQGGGLLCRG